MTKHYAVTITASRAEIDAQTYARRLGTLLDRSSAELEEAIRTDTVVIERGLSYSEAIEIQRELSRRKIPAEVSAREELSGRELLLRGASFGEELGDVDVEDAEAHDGAEERPDAAGDGDEGEVEETTGDEDDADPGAWAELFPDLAEEAAKDEEESDNADWASESFASGPLVMDKPDVGTSADPPDTGAENGQGEPEDFAAGEEAAGGAGFGAKMSARSVESGGTHGATQSGRFDAEKIRDAFSGKDSDRPPYKPKGYDKRPEHVPLVAAVLSAFAPGAGQVFNGQPEKAQRYALTFFLIYPWVQSVRQAMKYGEKVRTYYAPRPDPGTGKKAVLFGVKWWVVVVLIAVVSSGLVSMIQDHQREQAELRHQRALSNAVDAAAVYVARSSRRADKAADDVEIDEEDDGEEDTGFTMDDIERAQRAFIIGYHYCKGGNYAMCEQMMGRVTAVKPANSDAHRLRAWAGIQRNSPDPEREIPEINGEVPTLDEFELQLAVEGKELDDVDEHFEEWWNIEGERRVRQMEDDDYHVVEDDGGEDAIRRVEEVEVEAVD